MNSSATSSSDTFFVHNTTEIEPDPQEWIIFFSVFTTALSIGTVVGNVLVLLSVRIFRSLRTVPNCLIASLATADLTMGLIVMPMGSHYILNGAWLMGRPMCEIWISVDVLSVTASIGTLGLISVDRLVAVYAPFKYPKIATRSRAKIAIICMWIISVVIAFVPVQLGWWKSAYVEDFRCYQDKQCCEFLTNPTYAVVSSCVSFYIPLTVMVVSYYIVFKAAKDIDERRRTLNHHLRRHSSIMRQKRSSPGSNSLGRRHSIREGFNKLMERRNQRSLFMAKIIMGTFICCWLPFFIINILDVLCKRCVGKIIFTLANWLGYANSLFNPCIYCHSLQFRRAFKKLVTFEICRKGYRRTSRGSLTRSPIRRHRRSLSRIEDSGVHSWTQANNKL